METNNAKFPDDPSVTLTIRLIMQGKVSHLHTIIDFHLRRLSTMPSLRAQLSWDSLLNHSLRLINHRRCKSFNFTIFHVEFTLLHDFYAVCRLPSKVRNEHQQAGWFARFQSWLIQEGEERRNLLSFHCNRFKINKKPMIVDEFQ